LAQKIGKDKGYVENRLRLADAPTEIKQLVSLRKDTVSHAYELLKIEDPRKRRRLAEQVGRGELSLLKLREKIEGRPRPMREPPEEEPEESDETSTAMEWAEPAEPLREDSLVTAKQSLADALDELGAIFRSREALAQIGEVDRANLAKYLTIAKLRLENVITVVRQGEGGPH
jgi:ParB-like chromosome segregation protein Spo0J